jgi:RNA polymerase sigma-32 factor
VKKATSSSRKNGKPAKKRTEPEAVPVELITDKEPIAQNPAASLAYPRKDPFSESENEPDDATEEETEDALPDEADLTESLDDFDFTPASFDFEDEPKALPQSEYDDRNLPRIPGERSVRVRDNLHLYLQEINRFPLLQAEEELSLARSVRENGDPDAAFRLISSHLRLVVRIAMDFQRRWMQNVLDLIQEGNVGLIRAVSKFDPEKGIKFSYYAAFWIKAYILKFIMDNWRMVKIGTTQAQRKLFYNLNKERQRLISQGFDPDAATLSKNLKVTEEQITEMEQRMDATDMSLNLPMNTDEPFGATRMDYLPALGPGIEDTLANGEIASMLRERLRSLVPHLSDKEQYILQNRLLTDEPITLREIGEKYAITRERVRQIEARLLQKIRDHLFKNIKDFSEDWVTRQ